MGWAYDKTCFPSMDLAKADYFANFHPFFGTYSSAIYYWQLKSFPVPTMDVNGLITYQMIGRATTTTTQSIYGFVQLQSCTDTPADTYDYLAAAAMFNFAFIGVFSLWYLAKNIGYIKRAVKWF